MSFPREWMYTKRNTSNAVFNPTFQQVVTSFLDFAYTNATNIRSETIEGVQTSVIRCPCAKCKNCYYKSRETVECDLYHNGFMQGYLIWYKHGESFPTQDVGQCSNPMSSQHVGHHLDHVTDQEDDVDLGEFTEYDQMIMEGMHQNQHPYYQQEPQHENQRAYAYYTMLEQANTPLYDGSKKESTLSTTTSLLHWKSECNVSDSAFDKLLPIFKGSLPDGNNLPTNFYETKKMLKPLELPSQQIHVCKNHYMLFYGEFSEVDHCLVCKKKRFKQRGKNVPKLVMTYMPIGPRLQRLFYSKKTAKHLSWHAVHHREMGKMCHLLFNSSDV